MVHKSERSLVHNALNNNTKQFQLYLYIEVELI